jgi:DHA1 family solute carrier family 18 vesicular amine transporter 1/2
MRRLVVVACAMAVVETGFYSALTPLLPTFRGQLGLSKVQVGLLVAMYALGLCVASVPVGLVASAVGVKRAAQTGLLGLAATSVAFGIATSYWELLVTRVLQGAAGALCWTAGIAWLVEAAPRTRRSAMIGILSGAAALGAVVGPGLGGAAALVGRTGAFTAAAAFTALVALAAASLPRPSPVEWQPLAQVGRAHASLELWGGQWLVGLPGLLLGTVGVLAPLRLHRLGFGPIGIATTYLVAAALGIVTRPAVGRWADRQGHTAAIRLLLAACVAVTVVVPSLGDRWLASMFVVLAVCSYGLLWGPTMASLSQAYEQAGIAQAVGFALMNLTVGVAIVVGSAAAGEIAHLAGDLTAYGLMVATCLITITGLTIRPSSQQAV